MKDNDVVIDELRKELYNLDSKLQKLCKLKYGNTPEYLKLGTQMCCLLDIQENIIKSYREVLIARIVLMEGGEKEC